MQQNDTGRPGGRFDDWVVAERGRFVIWLPVFMAAGVVAYDALLVEPPGWVGAVAGLGALGVARFGRVMWLRLVAVLVVAVCLGMASAQFATWRAAPMVDLPTRATIVSGTVRAVEQLPQGRRVTIERASLDGGAPLARTIRLRLKAGDEVELGTGDTVRVRALLSRPSPPSYPGAWDLQRDAFFAGQSGFGFALNPAERMAEGAPVGVGAWLQGMREDIVARVNDALAPTEAAIAGTLLTGGTAAIPEADRAAFRDSGLAHLLAIAGLHIGIVMAWSFGATRLGFALSEHAALHWPLKAIAAVAALGVGGFYMMLTGAHVPIMRSFAMACLVTLGVVVGRRALSLRGLALAMVALILIAPMEVLGVSFQMSFSAVLALVAGYEALRPWLTRVHGDGAWWRRLAGHVVALGLTSALAGTASAPYGAYHFGHVQLYYIVANVIAVPLTAFWVMPMGMLALLAMPLGLEDPFLVAMGWGIDGVLVIGRSVSAWPAAVLAVPHMPAWGLAVMSVGIAWLGIWRSRVRLVGLVGILVGTASPMMERLPDVLVSPEARLIAVRTGEGVVYQQISGASRFTREAWWRYWNVAAPVRLMQGGPCDGEMCRIAVGGRSVVIARKGGSCAADLVVSAEPLRLGCGAEVATIDRFNVWRQGAHAAWLGPDGVRVVSDKAYRGDRPWVLGPPSRSAIPRNLQMAPAEILPED
jgi:competence protein ComEC